jgi:hypothetical protein
LVSQKEHLSTASKHDYHGQAMTPLRKVKVKLKSARRFEDFQIFFLVRKGNLSLEETILTVVHQ